MWRGVQIIPYDTLSEILVRISVLAIVCMLHIIVEPHMQDITHAELLYDYKRPRRESLISPTFIILIVFAPLIIIPLPSITTGSYMDTTQSLLAWTLAVVINAFVTESGKLIVGRPRPDFFYRCFPNGRMSKDLECTGVHKDVMEGRKSFPSGHSSFSFCSLGFISIWMCGKLRVLSTNRGDGLRVVVCLAPLVGAGVVAMTRCCDNHHHWEDVFVGSMIGFTCSYFCYRQYYYPLDSEQAGSPYDRTEDELQIGESFEECCTKALNNTYSVGNIRSKRNKYD